MNITSIVRLCLALLCCLPPDCIFANDDLLIIRDGDLPILITAPHGGRLELQDVPVRPVTASKKDLPVSLPGEIPVRKSWPCESSSCWISSFRAALPA
ncbi:MAG: hypothetical protein ACK5TG_04780 [Planctomyces sp.]|jgi:hypothetical protein